jgi:hypothetical protein
MYVLPTVELWLDVHYVYSPQQYTPWLQLYEAQSQFSLNISGTSTA